eukprot:547738-Karenia_brevis.AAC.1
MVGRQWQHEIREHLRLAQWKAASTRRPEFSGIECGVDRQATRSLLTSSAVNDHQKGILRAILTGAVRSGENLFKAGL